MDAPARAPCKLRQTACRAASCRSAARRPPALSESRSSSALASTRRTPARRRPSRFADEEINFGPFAAADPVALQRLDRLAPVELGQLVDQAVGVLGDAEHPLPQRQTRDRMAAALALAVDHFLVGEHRPKSGAPVDRSETLIGQTLLVLIAADRFGALTADLFGNGQFGNRAAASLPLATVRAGPFAIAIKPGVEQDEKNPLGPAEVVRIGRGELAVPVVAEPSICNWRRNVSMFLYVVVRGWVPVFLACCSAGRPKASQPIVCRTCLPRMRLKRQTISVAV